MKCKICKVCVVLAMLGAINWGLVGAFNMNLVEHILGVGTMATKVVYVVIGISGLGLILGMFKMCPACKK